ncbi:MAG: helix-turn-helix domain-containing protein [Patescibacteria group bacterium]
MGLRIEVVQQARALLQQGYSVRQVAERLGCSRKDVEKVAIAQSGLRNTRLTVTCALMLLLIAWLVAPRRHEDRVPAASATPATLSLMDTNILAAYELIAAGSIEDRWLLEKEVFTGSELAHERNVLARLKDELEGALDHYTTIAEVRALKNRFGGQIAPSLFSDFGGGSSKLIGIPGEEIATLSKKARSGIEVVFYPRSHAQHPRLKGQHLLYDNLWRVCIMAMLDYPDRTWRDAAFIHELWHAKRDRDGAASAHAPPLSDSWISEELEAHALQAQVMNIGTASKYRKLLEQTVSHAPARTVHDFLTTVPPTTFRMLDTLFQQPMRGEAEFRTAQYVLNLGVAWLEHHQKNQARQEQEKIALYRSIVRPHTMTVHPGR